MSRKELWNIGTSIDVKIDEYRSLVLDLARLHLCENEDQKRFCRHLSWLLGHHGLAREVHEIIAVASEASNE